MAMRAAMHRLEPSALSQLLRGHPPGSDEREILSCSCGHKARYREMRVRRVLTAVIELSRARSWYLCPHCHNGQCPDDAVLDIEKTDFSPGVRRMLALVGSDAPFDHGRQQIELLAGLEVTAKTVERTAEAIIGADIRGGRTTGVDSARPATAPAHRHWSAHSHVLCGNGWNRCPRPENRNRRPVPARSKGEPDSMREAKLIWQAFSPRPRGTRKAMPYAIPNSTTYVAAIEIGQ